MVVLVAVVGAVVATTVPASATIADKRNDYTGDSRSDLVAINYFSGCLVRWSGNGSGGFGSGTQLGCGWDSYVGSLASPGDLNGDGNGDLVAINHDSGCLVRWSGNGSGGFGSGTQLTCGWAPYAGSLTGAGDLNNDGNGDLIAVNAGSGCLVRWFGNGTGGFGAGTQLTCGWSPYSNTMTGAGDLDNDGNADIVAVNAGSGCLVRWFGNGTGGFGAGTQLGCGWDPYAAVGALSGMGALNGDGAGDLVAIDTGSGCLVRWFGNGTGGFDTGTQLTCGWNSYYLAT